MPRPRRILEVLEKARQLHGQLERALKLLREYRGSLEALAALGVEPVDASIAWVTKTTEYGEYKYPVLRLCPPVYDNPITECKQVYVTRFRSLAEVFVKAAAASKTVYELSAKAKEVLALLEELEKLVEELGRELELAEELAKTIVKPGTGEAKEPER